MPGKEEENGVTEDHSWREKKRGWNVIEEALCCSDGEELHKQTSVAFFGHSQGETHACLHA